MNKQAWMWRHNHQYPNSQLHFCSFFINVNMAESFVFNVADSLLGKLASYAYQEASRAYGAYDDLQGIKDTLSIVRGLLLDAECNKDQQHWLREWLRQIQNICSDAEAVLDGFDFQHKRKQVAKASSSNSMKVRQFFSSSNSLVFRPKMAYQIKKIRDRLDKVAADGTKFGLATINVDPRLLKRREVLHSHVDASSVIGREKDREEILKLLVQPHPHDDGDKSLCVIPIVGIGGLGKTTLAKAVFNDKKVIEFFQLKMWVSADDFDIRKIIIKIINSAYASTFASTMDPVVALAHQNHIRNLDIDQLQSHLRYKLSGHEFLLILDDVWNDDRAKWFELTDLIKDGAPGSKIIVTTRNNSIASMMSTVPSYVLKGLSPENCLSLFVKWAFKEGEEKKYPNLVEIGKEIVKKCAGVPLAVRTLGRSLFSKFDLRKWEFVRDNEIWNIEQKTDDVLPALKLSYDEMPSYLRQCFAYFSLFPKGFEFNSGRITSLWVAHGLVQSLDGSEKMEDIAREYIDKLNSRSFLQDVEDLGYFCLFKVHDLIHDLALYVAKEEFLVVDSHTQNIPEQARHLSIVENGSLDYALFAKSRSVRTILFPIDGVGLANETLLNAWISSYKYLWILDLRDSSFETLPHEIAKLEHLRVLILSNNRKIKKLPNFICKLQNLQLLSVKGCTELETLPKGLGKLTSLRKLFITTKQCVLSCSEFASLNHLEILSFQCCDNLKSLFSEAQQLTSLETLSVQSCAQLESLPLYIFPNLQNVILEDCNMLNMSLNNKSPVQRLKMKHLYLRYFPRLLSLPEWIVCAADTLETLVISYFPNLEMLPEWLATMTRLKRLHIHVSPHLKSLPSEMHQLTALEDLRISRCPELYRKYQPQSGEYWSMIAHIKHVSIGR